MSTNGGTNLPRTHTNGAAWRKSSFSGVMDCVELARQEDRVGIRDSKHPNAGHLALTPDQMAGLVAHIKAGELDSFLA